MTRNTWIISDLSSPLSSLSHLPVCVSYVHVSMLLFPLPHHYTPSSNPLQGSTAPSSTHSNLPNINPSFDLFTFHWKDSTEANPEELELNEQAKTEANLGTVQAAQLRHRGRRCGRGRVQHRWPLDCSSGTMCLLPDRAGSDTAPWLSAACPHNH